jgi:hypothetical protein
MRPSEFNARFLTAKPGEDFDPPACDTGLILLHRWAAHDPTLDRMLPKIPEDAEGQYAEAFYRHQNKCPKCNEARMINISGDIQI